MKDITEKDIDVCALFSTCDVCLTAGCFYVDDTCVSGPANGVCYVYVLYMYAYACVYV